MLLVAIVMVGLVVLVVGLPHLRGKRRAQVEVFIESEVLARRRTAEGTSGEETPARACPRCGDVYDRADRFCRRCGTRLQEE